MRSTPFVAFLFAAVLLTAAAAQEASPVPAYGGPKAFPYPFAHPAAKPEELRDRRERLAALMKDGVAVLVSDEIPSLYSGGRYRPGNNIHYFTGVETDFCALILTAKKGKIVSETLYLPGYDASYELWNGKRTVADDAARAASGISDVVALGASSLGDTYGAFEVAFDKLIDDGATLYLEAGPTAGRVRTKSLQLTAKSRASMLREHVQARLGDETKPRNTEPAEDDARDPKGASDSPKGRKSAAASGKTRIKNLTTEATKLRSIKSPHEIALIREAVRVTGEAYARAVPQIRPGMWEFEFDAMMQGSFVSQGCTGLPYYPIAASGPNSCVLHYSESRRRMEDGDLLLSDIAAEWGWYAADITRTFPVNGKFTPRQRQVYEAVLAGQTAAATILRPGVDWGTLDRECKAAMMAAGLKSSELQPHGLGHPVGLDVHDCGGQVMEPGMLVTIEPGSYLKREGFGVRIEDVYLITETGNECLSKGIPRAVADVEAMTGRDHRK